MTGHLPDNILAFARLLRAAGVAVGPGEVIAATEAAALIGPQRRDDFQSVLAATLLTRHEHRAVFDQAFHLFWRNPHLRERAAQLLLSPVDTGGDTLPRRLADAVGGTARSGPTQTVTELDLALSGADDEQLRRRDFETMSAAEFATAKRAIKQIAAAIPTIPSRRMHPGSRGRQIDLRATLQAATRQGGEILSLQHLEPVRRAPPLITLCDISGSMGRYARVLLHFAHALSTARGRTHHFVFGTRLTNITRALRQRDVDQAVEAAAGAVQDWSGGTRIGTSIAAFNRLWSRRVLGSGAIVLLITDGLDRDASTGLAEEIQRLQRSCARLIWLNPLLRWDGFEPRAQGIRAILPHVDEFRPVHSLHSLDDLARALLAPAPDRARRSLPHRKAA